MKKTGDIVAVNFTEEIRARVEKFMEDNSLTLDALALRTGTNASAISRYLTGNPTGDVAKLEKNLSDYLSKESRRKEWNDIYFETKCVKTCHVAFDIIWDSGDIGLVHGAAGLGKSTACNEYAKQHPTALFFTVIQGRGNDYDLVKELWSLLPTARAADDRRLRRAEYVLKKMRGSGRLLIIDNAQRLSMSGLRWLNDFNDVTACPIALVGNDEVLTKIKNSSQMSSRVGFKQDIGKMIADDDGSQKWLHAAADEMVKSMWPEAASEIKYLARDAADRPGHLRTLKKQLRIAIRLASAASWGGTRSRAFAEARSLIGSTDNVKED